MLAGVRALAWTLPARPDREACAELASVSFLFLFSFEARGRDCVFWLTKVTKLSSLAAVCSGILMYRYETACRTVH